MNLKDGDIVTLDDVEMLVKPSAPDGYWLSNRGNDTYFYTIFRTAKELDELAASGRLKIGGSLKRETGKTICSFHDWKKYVGATELYNFCTKCGSKEFIDWRKIKDSKEY